MTQTVSKLSAIALAGVLAVATFGLFTMEASADRGHRGGDAETVINTDNEATVSNNVTVTANTGGNTADGGNGGRGDAGGDASRGDGGRGGNGGAGGSGGTVTTGAATAIGTVDNNVNRTQVHVEGCGCDDEGDGNPFFRFFRFNDDDEVLRVDTDNSATVRNSLDVAANTGRNHVDGGRGGAGAEGGDALGSRSWWFWWNQDNTGGNGGNGGAGGAGGTIRTGASVADGLVTNVVNRTVVRVENGDEQDQNPI